MRGCPYKCTFCSSSKFWKRARFFSAKYVVNEIEHVIERYKVKDIMLWDDLFIANKKRLREIAALIKERRIDEKISFSCSVRANLVNDELCTLLKDMNVTGVTMGLESGTDRILKYLKQGNVTVGDNTSAIQTCKKYGFDVGGSFIIGSPTETREEVLTTLNFIKTSKLDRGDIYSYTIARN